MSKVHFPRAGRWLTLCGKDLTTHYQTDTTTIVENVTCKSCVRSIERLSR